MHKDGHTTGLPCFPITLQAVKSDRIQMGWKANCEVSF